RAGRGVEPACARARAPWRRHHRAVDGARRGDSAGGVGEVRGGAGAGAGAVGMSFAATAHLRRWAPGRASPPRADRIALSTVADAQEEPACEKLTARVYEASRLTVLSSNERPPLSTGVKA